MKITLNHKVRWFLLLPLSFLSSLLTLLAMAFLASTLYDFFGEEFMNVFIAFASVCIVSAWLFTSYFVAPKHKESTVWVFYFIGSVIASSLAFFVYEESVANDDKMMALVFLVTSLLYGFLLSLKIQNKFSLQNFIDKEIKTTHL